MKDRIFQIMKQEGLNQKEFSETTGISPATLSSIFNGRTSPTLNHAEALHRRFPRLNMAWLMFGEGEMFVPTPQEVSTNSFPSTELPDTPSAPTVWSATDGDSSTVVGNGGLAAGRSSIGAGASIPVIREVVKYIDKPQRSITEIRIFFDDGTFETFPGRVTN